MIQLVNSWSWCWSQPSYCNWCPFPATWPHSTASFACIPTVTIPMSLSVTQSTSLNVTWCHTAIVTHLTINITQLSLVVTHWVTLSVYHHHHHDPFPGRPCNGRQGHLVEFLTPNISFWGAHTSHIRLCQPFHSCWWGWGVELHSITLDDNHDCAYEEVGRWLCWWSQCWWWGCSVLSNNKTMEIFSHPSHKRMRQTRATIMLLCWLPPPRWVRTSWTKISFGILRTFTTIRTMRHCRLFAVMLHFASLFAWFGNLA